MAGSDYAIATLDIPGAVSTTALGINGAGIVAGRVVTKDTGVNVTHGFVSRNGTAFVAVLPLASGAAVQGISSQGTLVGTGQTTTGAFAFTQTGSTYTLIAPAGATSSTIRAVSPDGAIAVGEYTTATGTSGFVEKGGIVTPIVVSGSLTTGVYGVNSAGDYVGFSTLSASSSRLFLHRNGADTTLTVTGLSSLASALIDPADDVAGAYTDTAHVGHVFLRIGGTTTIYNLPADAKTNVAPQIFGIDNAGEVAGAYTDAASHFHSFIISGGTLAVVAVPGAAYTQVTGINASGVIAGTYLDNANFSHGFIDDHGTFTTFDVPGSTYTQIVGIDDAGEVAGLYGNAGNHSFLALPNNTLRITTSVDERNSSFSGVQTVAFTSASPAAATFFSSQFVAGSISPTLTIVGGPAADTFNVTVNQVAFSAAGFLFQSWSLADTVVLYGNDATVPLSITGTSQTNLIFGGSAGDLLTGGSGTDNLYGGAGADTLDGGGGFNFARYDLAASAVTAVLFLPSVNTGEAAGDVYTNIQGVVGSNFDDNIQGDANGNVLLGLGGSDLLFGREGNDALYGGDGDDNLWGGTGTDYFDGGAGFDYARYDFAASGVIARLDNLGGQTGEAAGDYFYNMEGLVGSAFNDILVGDGGGNTILGLAGDDTLYGQDGNDALVGGDGNDQMYGGTGTDFMDGGAGFDYIRYDYATSGVAMNLGTGIGTAGEANGDYATNVEGLVGSYNGDFLVGSGGANVIFGLGGSDVIFGAGGSDTLYGGTGNDTFAFRASDFQSGAYTRIKDLNNVAGDNDAITLVGVPASQVQFYDTPNGAFITTAALAGSGGVIIENHTLAQIAPQIFLT